MAQDIQLGVIALQMKHWELLRKYPTEHAKHYFEFSHSIQFLSIDPQLEQILLFKKYPELHLVQEDEELH